MKARTLPEDPLWPRAGRWFTRSIGSEPVRADLALLGVPAFASSITPTGAHATPAAIRDALLRYSTSAASTGADISQLAAVDLGDVEEPDGPDGEKRVAEAVRRARDSELLIALGGDNSITYGVMRGRFPEGLEGCGLITVDAHHDVRDGETNGSPVRRLVEAGLPGANVVQVGIADFCNSPAYAARVRDLGITVIPRSELRGVELDIIAARALAIAGAGERPVYVDIDVDVCDRSAVPGCPSAAPGGISADDLRQLAFLLASDARVKGIDVTEIDAGSDAADRRTIRLGALLVLEAAAGLLTRRGIA